MHGMGHPGVLQALCENGNLDRKQPFLGKRSGDQERTSTTGSDPCSPPKSFLGIYARRGVQIEKYDTPENTHSNRGPLRASAA